LEAGGLFYEKYQKRMMPDEDKFSGGEKFYI
jgi:hypothetical protein